MEKEPDTTIVRLRVPGETESLSLVRTVVTHLARSLGFPEREVDKIEVAVDEACTNVLEHAYRFVSPKPPVQLEIRRAVDQLVVDIIDEGCSFDFNHYNPPKFPDHWLEGNTRGAGLYLIRQCMDEITYSNEPSTGNRLRLVKKLPTPAAT